MLIKRMQAAKGLLTAGSRKVCDDSAAPRGDKGPDGSQAFACEKNEKCHSGNVIIIIIWREKTLRGS